MANESLVNAQTRHFVHLQRVGTSEFNKFSKILAELERGILARLPGDLTEFSRTRLNKQLAELRNFQDELYDSYIARLNNSLTTLAEAEADFETNILKQAILSSSTFETTVPAVNQVLAALKTSPLSVGNNGAGKLLASFINDWKKAQIEAVNGIVRQGWFEGQTIGQMVSGVKDSIHGQTKRTAEAIIRTSINHVSQVSRTAVWNENDDIIIGWRFVATLDGRTTRECYSIASLAKVYPINKGPKPPRHINCRSTSIPELDSRFAIDESNFTQSSKGASGGKQVSAELTPIDWYKTQPKEWVFDTMGEKMGKLLFSGKMTSKEFARFNLDAMNNPLTITEMVAKDKKYNMGLFD